MISLGWIRHQIEVCDRKYVFDTRGRAIIFTYRRKLGLTPYRCQICGEWHLTSKPSRTDAP